MHRRRGRTRAHLQLLLVEKFASHVVAAVGLGEAKEEGGEGGGESGRDGREVESRDDHHI